MKPSRWRLFQLLSCALRGYDAIKSSLVLSRIGIGEGEGIGSGEQRADLLPGTGIRRVRGGLKQKCLQTGVAGGHGDLKTVACGRRIAGKEGSRCAAR